MSWLRNKFRRWLNDSEKLSKCNSIDTINLDNDGLRFRLMNADGGIVVEFRSYDIKTDRSNTKLYIIPDGSDVGKMIGEIITLEILRRN